MIGMALSITGEKPYLLLNISYLEKYKFGY